MPPAAEAHAAGDTEWSQERRDAPEPARLAAERPRGWSGTLAGRGCSDHTDTPGLSVPPPMLNGEGGGPAARRSGEEPAGVATSPGRGGNVALS
jgi:hypothetical protein